MAFISNNLKIQDRALSVERASFVSKANNPLSGQVPMPDAQTLVSSDAPTALLNTLPAKRGSLQTNLRNTLSNQNFGVNGE